MSELLNRNQPPLTESGLFPDLTGVTAPLFVDGRNIHFRGGAVTPMPGQVPLFTRPQVDKVTGLHSQVMSGTKTVVFGYLDALYKWDNTNGLSAALGSGYTGILKETGSQKATFWSLEAWGNWVLASNGQDDIQIYKGTSFADLTGTPPGTAEILVRRSPFMMALNTDTEPSGYQWCDADDVEDWVPGGASAAGAKVIRDMGSPLIAAREFREEIAAFGEDSMHLIYFIRGSSFYFGDRKLLSGIGAVGKNAVVPAGSRIYGWGTRGIWVTDGNSFDYLDTIAIKEFLYSEVDQEQMSQITAYHDQAWKHIVFFFPQKDNEGVNNMFVAFNYLEKNWTIGDFGRTIADRGAVFDQALLGGTQGSIFAQNNEIIVPQNYGQGFISTSASATLGSFSYGRLGYGAGGYGGNARTIDG